MSRISDALHKDNHKGLIAYVTVGYPTIEATLKVVPLLESSGCDLVELGIPFSDPLADGATIQKASFNALRNGVSPGLCLEVAGQLSSKVDIPLLFMGYYNPISHYGEKEFCRACKATGVSGFIVPDLPPEEGMVLETATKESDIDLIYLLAPTSTEKRIRLVAERSRGFIYLVSVTGVTGARNTLPSDLEEFVARVRGLAKQPLCVGFGISTPEAASRVAGIADGVIVGSRIIQLMETDESLAAVAEFTKSLRDAIDQIG